MALPAHVLERLPTKLRQNGLITTGAELALARGLTGRGPVKVPREDPWERVLLEGDWPEGLVSELALVGGWAGGTSLGLAACRRVQQAGIPGALAAEPSFCAFVDPSGSLYAPGVVQAGVRLSHLLVVRPRPEDLVRVTLRLVESHSLPLVVVDLVGTPERPQGVSLGPWGRVVQRLARAVEGTTARVLLLTDARAQRPLPLPVGLRVEVSRPAPTELAYRVLRSREGLGSTGSGAGGSLDVARANRLPAVRVSHVA